MIIKYRWIEKSLFLGIVISLISITVGKAANPIDTTKALENIFSKYSQIEPGAQIVITRKGKVIFSKNFGYANLETHTKISSKTLFMAGSVTKQFTAAAILLLVQEGKLALSDNVRKYIPELPKYRWTITIRNLLSQTSGIKDWSNITYLTNWPDGTRVMNQDFALRLTCMQSSLNFEPGSQYRYSNSNYDLLGIIVKRVSGESYSKFIEDNLLKSAGMKNSSIASGFNDIISNRSIGYIKRDGKYLQHPILDMTYGATGLITNAWDLQKWNEYINSPKVGEEFKKMRVQRMTLKDGTTIPRTNGGVAVQYINGSKVIYHGGLVAYFRTWLAYYPKKKISISYASNNKSISDRIIVRKLRELFLGLKKNNPSKEKTINLSVSKRREIAGNYKEIGNNANYLRIRNENGKLKNGKIEIKAITPDTLMIRDSKVTYKDARLIFDTPTGAHVYKKMKPFSLDATDLWKYTGYYTSADVDVAFQLKVKKGQLVSSNGYDKIKLTPLYRGKHKVTFLGFQNGLRTLYHFGITEKGKVTSLAISLPRAANIPFERKQ